MSTTKTAAVLASGTANAARLFVAALAFTSAYVGFSAYSNASSATEPAATEPAATEPAATEPAATAVTLSAREAPVTEELAIPVRPGEISLSALTGAGCAKSYVARSVVVNRDSAQGVQYRWRLARWSPAAKAWRTYVTEYDGFAGAARTVEWRPQISGNPGWYRVEVAAEGAETVKSDRFQVSC
ncbi:hypothetical protein [Nonomuraea sp. NPDC049480]|uniref:hypothetical protein n=1 Tax=Nonomuraea sp. NPDC049480 TaxID=3364353 RepID=UPI00379281BC